MRRRYEEEEEEGMQREAQVAVIETMNARVEAREVLEHCLVVHVYRCSHTLHTVPVCRFRKCKGREAHAVTTST